MGRDWLGLRPRRAGVVLLDETGTLCLFHGVGYPGCDSEDMRIAALWEV